MNKETTPTSTEIIKPSRADYGEPNPAEVACWIAQARHLAAKHPDEAARYLKLAQDLEDGTV